jgi:hypothetical protein
MVEDCRDALLEEADQLGAPKDRSGALRIDESDRTLIIENLVRRAPESFREDLLTEVSRRQDLAVGPGRDDVLRL